MALDRQALLGTLSAITDRDELAVAISGMTEAFETEHVVYHSISHSGEEFAVGTYTEEWKQFYVEQDMTWVDPVVRDCLKSYGPVYWEQCDWTRPAAARLMADALDAGIGNHGVSIPIRGPEGQFAVFTLNTTSTDEAWAIQRRELMSDAILVSHFVNQKVLELIDCAGGRVVGELSPRERDVLSLLAVGQTRTQAAETLGISAHTVRVYLESARRKVGAENTLHTVARAQSLGFLSV